MRSATTSAALTLIACCVLSAATPAVAQPPRAVIRADRIGSGGIDWPESSAQHRRENVHHESNHAPPPSRAVIQRTQFPSFTTPEYGSSPGAAPGGGGGIVDRGLSPGPFAAGEGGLTPPGMRRIDVFPRTNTPVQAQWFPSDRADEWVAVITAGVNLIVDGIPGVGAVDVLADRVVIWTTGLEEADMEGRVMQRDDTPLEIYMEGNIVFRQGDRIIHADRMYYNVPLQIGTVLDAQIFTPVPEFLGVARLKADVVQQLDRDRYVARQAAVTTSRIGIPRYWFQSDTLTFQNFQTPLVDPFTGQQQVDAVTGQPLFDQQHQVSGRGNSVRVAGVPILYWPWLETDLRKPTYYLADIRIKNDGLFGNQIYTTWDTYQVLGIANPPAGTDWEFNLDYLDRRGPAAGTTFFYDRTGMFGLPNAYRGGIDSWFIHDRGMDNLGRDRRALEPEETFRGRVRGAHRQWFANGMRLTGELGWISDRNFLEQYFEHEWDQEKDFETRLQLERLDDNRSWTLEGSARLNGFVTQTQWLPRFDHFWLGEPLFDRFTWYAHTHAAYADMRAASTPTDPADAAKFEPLPWEGDFAGERFATRQEIDLPMTVGWARVVPYALGELAHWGSDLEGNDVQRAYGQFGVRASVPMGSVNPWVQSELWNLNGLAHKVVFETDLSYADANRDMERFPLYDPLDDDAVEHFRRRFFFDTFGLMPGDDLPQQFDERNYALRRGLGGWVTSPSTEVADDLVAMRFGVRQRWQTKRGAPGQQRIVDWIVLDTRGVWFPKDERDNFGEPFGLLEYDFRWHLGERVSLVSDGIFDTFAQGQRIYTVGTFFNRPPLGSLYVGYRSLEGPIQSNVVAASFTYRMGPKWLAAASASYDFGPTGNIGQNFAITRVGESLLVRTGINVDASRGIVGAVVSVEPRFWPRSRIQNPDGAHILPPGPFELE